MWHAPARSVFLLVMTMASSTSAWALCCPTGGQVNAPAGSGIGQSQPRAADLSRDPRWTAHEFERDAISYFQISNSLGVIDFILGKAGHQYWLLPAGPTETQVVLPDESKAVTRPTDAKVILEHAEFRLLVSETAGTVLWHVETIPPRP